MLEIVGLCGVVILVGLCGVVILGAVVIKTVAYHDVCGRWPWTKIPVARELDHYEIAAQREVEALLAPLEQQIAALEPVRTHTLSNTTNNALIVRPQRIMSEKHWDSRRHRPKGWKYA